MLDKVGRTRAMFFTGSPLVDMEGAVLALLKESTADQVVERVEPVKLHVHEPDSDE